MCEPLADVQGFADRITSVERNPVMHEEHSAMIQNFVLVDAKGGCKLDQKLENLSAAKVALPIIADSVLWQISSQ